MKYDIPSINRRIRNIKSKGLQPVTLKSDADMFARIIAERGTSKEGEILTYSKAKKQYENYLASRRVKGVEITEDFTEEIYKEKLQEFIDILGERTSVNKTYTEAYTIALKGVIPDMAERSPELFQRFMKMSVKDRVNFLRDFGNDWNVLKGSISKSDEYKYGEAYLNLLEQWLENYGM